jgi:hypothetical protein
VRSAFAYARTRARRSTLAPPEQLDALHAAASRRELFAALRVAGLEPGDPATVRTACVARFVGDAERLVASWPRPSILRAVVGLQEIENLAIASRALRGGIAVERWAPLWIDLGAVAELDLETFTAATSLRSALDGLPEEPWGERARRAFRAHEGDPAAFELALDAAASARLLGAGADVPDDAAALATAVVRLRDLDALARSAVRGLRPEDAGAATVFLRREWRAPVLEALARGEVPQPVRDRWPSAVTLPTLRKALREALHAACLRTFRSLPFRLATGVALLLLRDEEIRSVTSAVEARFELERE